MPPLHISELVVGSSSRYASAAQAQVREPADCLEKVEPKLMQYRDISRAVNTVITSLKASRDPLEHYMDDTPDRTEGEWKNRVVVLMHSYWWAKSIHEKIAWTINHGESVIVCTSPGFGFPDRPIDTIIDGLIDSISASRLSKLQRKRHKEFRDKIHKALETSLGDRQKDMFSISGLATAPAKQGRGYASALVRMVSSMADERGCATWLGSSNVRANDGFYRSLGFVTVLRFHVGDEDPDWTEDPVPIDLMVREPQSAALKEKAALV